MAVSQELMGIPDMPETRMIHLLADEKRMVANFKKAVLMAASGAAQKLGMELAKHQETLMHIADMVIDTYLAGACLLRTPETCRYEGAANVAEQVPWPALHPRRGRTASTRTPRRR